MALTDKQQRFVEEYMVDLNATQAAIRAGYSQDTAKEIGCENLTKPNIQEAIQKRKQELSEQTGVSAQRIIEEYAKIAFSDVRNILTVDGGLKDASEWEDDSAGAIASIKSFEVTTPEGEKLGTNREVKMYDKLRALEALGKHIGLFEKDNKQKQAEVQNIINLGSGVKPKEDE
ncbi:terminase small subunit [Sphingobacterium mizutaii]|uniref:terminase small subunit n=1 Tax=Sphingobacterium mizutaii TaxID=1010 RepID=UPI0028A063FD|nr:terminase small subunit [Sphingobacterium mizutaii]